MRLTAITATLGEPLLTIYSIYNKPLTPWRYGYRNCLRYNTPMRRHLVDFIKSYN